MSNQIGPAFPVKQNGHLGCVKRLRDRAIAAGKPLRDDEPVQLLQSTLPMGDVNATDFGQAAHANVLAAGGALDNAELVAYRQPVPRTKLWHMLMIDDNVVSQIYPSVQVCPPGRS